MKLFDKIFKSQYDLLELGNEYFYGIHGKESNLDLAYEYFLMAAKKGNQTAATLLDNTFVPGKPEIKEEMADIYKLMKCMRLAVETGDPQACFFYGVGKLSQESDDYMYRKGLNWVKQAAEKEFPPAMHAYGLELLKGNRIPQDKALGMEYIKKAAIKGETNAISLLYSLGEQDIALDVLNQLVREQNPKAIALLAEIKLQKRNYEEGITLMEQAASLGDKNAMFNVGVIFDNGKYCEKDPYKAAMWYQKAAELGDAQSMENLGYLLEKGPEELRNEKAAFDLYNKAAENGLNDAWNDVATCYKRGIGIEQSAKKAQEYYLKAAQYGNPAKAYYNLFMLFSDGIACSPDHEEALKWITKAAEMDLPEACWHLGKLYEIGLGVEKDPNQAFRWFNIAADKGEPRVMLEIGKMYLNGTVVDRDTRKGFEYIKKASEYLVEAMGTLGHCYINGLGCRQDYELALECYTKAA